MDTVLVTGANGHLGYNLTQQLVERGYRVRAGVRDFTSKTKTRDLVTLGAEITHVDITRPETLSAAMKDVQGLFHVAAVYETISRNPGRDVKQPTIVGTINTLQAAHAAGVQKVVLTSSATTVGNDASLAAPLDESRWNKDAIEPYVQAKTSAEQWAWEFATRNHFNLVAILPSAMIGPGFRRHTPTTRIFEELLRNRVPVVLPLGFSFVDVRDVATAHVLAYENPTAAGRYIASARFCELAELFTPHSGYPHAQIARAVASSCPITRLDRAPFRGNTSCDFLCVRQRVRPSRGALYERPCGARTWLDGTRFLGKRPRYT